MGALVWLTAIFAWLSAGYAFFTVFESLPAAIGLGALWALLILNVDRLILMTFPKSDPWWRRLVHAVPRVVLAVFIAIAIAHPITLRLFEPEILDRVAKERESERSAALWRRDADRTSADAKADAERRALTEFDQVEQRKKESDEAAAKARSCESRQAQQEKDYLCEADGTCGTRTPECGPVCKEKKAVYEHTAQVCEARRHDTDQATLALTQAQQQLAKLVSAIAERARTRREEVDREHQPSVWRVDATGKISFLARSDALGLLSDERPKVARVRLFVALLFITAEIVAVFMAIITPADSADKLAFAIRTTFAERIPTLARQVDDAARSSPASAPPDPRREDPWTESEGLTGPLGRRITAVALTALITGGMLYFGRGIGEATAAGSLFATMAPWALHYTGGRSR